MQFRNFSEKLVFHYFLRPPFDALPFGAVWCESPKWGVGACLRRGVVCVSEMVHWCVFGVGCAVTIQNDTLVLFRGVLWHECPKRYIGVVSWCVVSRACVHVCGCENVCVCECVHK